MDCISTAKCAANVVVNSPEIAFYCRAGAAALPSVGCILRMEY
jgi:hypothetical protein